MLLDVQIIQKYGKKYQNQYKDLKFSKGWAHKIIQRRIKRRELDDSKDVILH